MNSYWTQRAAAREADAQAIADIYLADMKKQFKQKERHLKRQTESFYARYGDDIGVSKAQARKRLTADELEDFVALDLEPFRALSIQGNPEYDDLLNRASYRRRISRLEAEAMRLEMQVYDLYGNTDGIETLAKSGMGMIYETGFYGTHFDIAKVVGAVEIKRIAPRAMKEILAYNWSGKEFSKRIWGHQKRTQTKIRAALVQGVNLGRHSSVVARDIAKALDVSYNQAEALVRTETTFFHEMASQESYKEAGIERYEILATLDSRTSQICREQDGRVYKQKEYEPGKNAPPFHVRCRSTTVPVIDDYVFEERRRAGAELIPNMTYSEWEKRYVK